jgi:hypothetical protein
MSDSTSIKRGSAMTGIWRHWAKQLRDYALFGVASPTRASIEALSVLVGQNSSALLRHEPKLAHLADAEFRVFSQWGEDGILEWLIQRLSLSATRFIEFGVGDYKEANTRFLLAHRNWKGLVIDANQAAIRALRSDPIYWRHDLTAVSSFIDRDNINTLITGSGFSGPLGLLSIDIDGNDYWVLESIDTVLPDIIVCEYNSVFGDLNPISIPYVGNFQRGCAHSSNLYYGASISALVLLANRKGYSLVGTNRAGSNAFFVRNNLFTLIDPLIASKAPLPSVVRESRDKRGKLTFLSGMERTEAIANLPVVRVDTGERKPLGNLQPLFSSQWIDIMSGNPFPALHPPRCASQADRTGEF